MRRRGFLRSCAAALAGMLFVPGRAAAQSTILGRGTFRDGDPAHPGSGAMEIRRDDNGATRIALTDLRVRSGPDLFVCLVAEPDPLFPEDVRAKYLTIDRLKGLTGDQVYPVPDGVDMTEWGSVVVWCEEYSRIFAVATIRRP